MECSCVLEKPETTILRDLESKGLILLKEQGIDVAGLEAMGYSEWDAIFAIKMAAVAVGLKRAVLDQIGVVDDRAIFLFVDGRPGVANTLDFFVKNGQSGFILYSRNIEEAFIGRMAWIALKFPGVSKDALILALAAKAVRRYLNYRGLVQPFSIGDAEFSQGPEVEVALKIADEVIGRYKGKLSPEEIGIKYDGMAIQMVLLVQSSRGGEPPDTIEYLINYVTMGHPDRSMPAH